MLMSSIGLIEVEGQEYMTEPDACVEELIDSMSCAFYSLAATGTVRVGRLCKGPHLLACWALELLEEQACHVSPHTLRFTHTKSMNHAVNHHDHYINAV